MRKGELTRQAILDQAVSVAARAGLSGLTIGTLARATDMSKSGLYGHFNSLERLQLDTLQHARDGFVDLILRPALRAPRGEARVRALFERWCTAGLSRQANCAVMVRAAVEFDDRAGPVHDAIADEHRDLAETCAQIVGTAIAAGDFRDDVDPDQFARDLYGIVLALFHAARLMADPRAEERALRAFEALVTAARPHQPPDQPRPNPRPKY